MVPYASQVEYVTPTLCPSGEAIIASLSIDHGAVTEENRKTILETIARGRVSAAFLDICVVRGWFEATQWIMTTSGHSLIFDYCGPVRKAVDCSDLRHLQLLLGPDMPESLDINVGAPLRAAVLKARPDFVAELIYHPRINPNRGAPLFYAVTMNDLPSVRLIAEHPHTNVNKFTPTQGTPPLCQAIEHGHEDLICYLLGHSRIDVNKGYFSTPLEVAIRQNRAGTVRLLLSRPALQVNKTHSDRSPLERCFRMGNIELAELLLADPRTEIDERMLDLLEEEGDLEALQHIAECDASGMKTGRTWNRRFGFGLVCVMLNFVEVITNLNLVVLLTRNHLTVESFLVVAAQIISCCGCALLLFKHHAEGSIFLRVVPFVAAFDALCVFKMMYLSTSRPANVYHRHHLFMVFCKSTSLKGYSQNGPLLLLCIAFLFITETTRSLTGNLVFSGVVCLAALALGWVAGRQLQSLGGRPGTL